MISAYLGALGRLIPVHSTPTMTVAAQPRYKTETTLEGRVKAQVMGLGRRQWSLVAASADTQQAGTLQGFAGGEWGHGPFVWVTPTAPLVNMLTPAQGNCDPSTLYTAGVTAAGPLSLGVDGWAGRSFTNPAPATAFYFGSQTAPVIPGRSVTASAWVVGAGAGVRIQWIDAAGSFISSSSSAGSGVAGVATRVSVTAMPPANAAGAQVLATNAAQGARPALTWTPEVFPWGAGEGCPAAIVEAIDQTMLRAADYARGRRPSDLTYTITEIG